jgi:hypothetical protein
MTSGKTTCQIKFLVYVVVMNKHILDESEATPSKRTQMLERAELIGRRVAYVFIPFWAACVIYLAIR